MHSAIPGVISPQYVDDISQATVGGEEAVNVRGAAPHEVEAKGGHPADRHSGVAALPEQPLSRGAHLLGVDGR